MHIESVALISQAARIAARGLPKLLVSKSEIYLIVQGVLGVAGHGSSAGDVLRVVAINR